MFSLPPGSVPLSPLGLELANKRLSALERRESRECWKIIKFGVVAKRKTSQYVQFCPSRSIKYLATEV